MCRFAKRAVRIQTQGAGPPAAAPAWGAPRRGVQSTPARPRPQAPIGASRVASRTPPTSTAAACLVVGGHPSRLRQGRDGLGRAGVEQTEQVNVGVGFADAFSRAALGMRPASVAWTASQPAPLSTLLLRPLRGAGEGSIAEDRNPQSIQYLSQGLVRRLPSARRRSRQRAKALPLLSALAVERLSQAV